MTCKHKPKQWKGYAWFASERMMKDPSAALFYDTVAEAEYGSTPRAIIVPATITLSAPKRPATRKK